MRVGRTDRNLVSRGSRSCWDCDEVDGVDDDGAATFLQAMRSPRSCRSPQSSAMGDLSLPLPAFVRLRALPLGGRTGTAEIPRPVYVRDSRRDADEVRGRSRFPLSFRIQLLPSNQPPMESVAGQLPLRPFMLKNVIFL